MTNRIRAHQLYRPTSMLLAAAIVAPTLAGCGGSPPPPAESSGNRLPPAVGAAPQRSGGMTTKQKVVLLAGAAALYYMYRKNQNAQGQPVQYYRSETNGRIYYRDPKTKQAIWVTPPTNGIQVPYDEAQQYSSYQGYDNRNSGQAWGGYGPNGFANSGR